MKSMILALSLLLSTAFLSGCNEETEKLLAEKDQVVNELREEMKKLNADLLEQKEKVKNVQEELGSQKTAYENQIKKLNSKVQDLQGKLATAQKVDNKAKNAKKEPAKRNTKKKKNR